MKQKQVIEILECMVNYTQDKSYENVPQQAKAQAEALLEKPNPDVYTKILEKYDNYKIDKAIKTLRMKKEELQIKLLEQELTARENNIATGGPIIIDNIEI
jgi:Mg/Co/Ni transporter MgtE